MNYKHYKHLPPFKGMVLQNFPFIEEDFDAITNYQLLCKVVEYLKNVIANELTMEENVTTLYNAFIELKNYVDNYFANLDVQEEINNKLDEMVEDGTLLNILSNYANIERIYNTFSEILEDNTLISGQKVKCFGMLEINDGNGGEFIIDNENGIPLQNELYAKPLNNYEENFYNEITFTQERHYETDCYFTIIPLNDNDNNQIELTVENRDYSSQTPLNHAQDNLTTLTINASLSIVNQLDSSKNGVPTIIGNGQILRDNSMYGETGIADNYLYLGIDEERGLHEFRVNNTTTEQLIASGCKNVFDVYYKLIENYFPCDLSNVVTNEEGVVTGYHPRQVFCEMNDKSIMIMTCDGRIGESKGLTSEQLQTILIEKGVKNAWNLDGGGSTSTEYKTVKINRNFDNSYITDRNIPYTLNAKKIIKNKNIANVYSFISKMFHFVNKRYQEERPRPHNISNEDVNNLIGKFIIGFGTSVINTPVSSCYFINIENSIVPANRYLYNKQICLDMISNRIYTREMRNGVWNEWSYQSNPLTRILTNDLTIENTGYTQLPITSIVDFDTNDVIINDDNTFSFKTLGGKLIYIECRVKGSTGNKFIKVQKNDIDLLFKSNYNPDDTHAYQLIYIAPLNVSNITDKFKIMFNANINDVIETITILVK